MLFSSGARAEKGSGKYSFISNLVYHYKNMLQWEPKLFIIGILMLVPWTLASILGDILPSAAVRGLEEKWELRSYIGILLLLILAMWLCNMLAGMAESYCYNGSNLYRLHYSRPYIQKKMRLDYDILEKKDFQTHSNAAYTAIYQGRGIDDAAWRLPRFLTYMGTAAVYGIMLARASIWILVLALVCGFVQIQILKYARLKHGESHPVLSDLSRKMSYMTSQSMEPAAGKDIRIYHMSGWLMKKYEDTLNAMNKEYYKVHNWYFVRGLSDAGLDLLRNGLVYGYLIYMVTAGTLTLSEFVLYFGFANSFGQRLFTAMREALYFGIISNTFSSIREYFDTRENRNEDSRTAADVMEGIRCAPVTLELKNVSYTYPGQDNPVISHMNLKITAGEKLALIGLNGAGKTTLVKLICGFYTPTEGEILMNDIPIENFERSQYYSLISVLFQDYTILPLTLDENIASVPKEEIDTAKLKECLERSGFIERYERLPQKGDSLLVKEIHDKAVDFSGGEKQRLLFARALYKEAPLLILDEPTAALDPIAENEVYLKYSEATKGKTSIYISHRLSSTRFCDRIVLLENGQIVETGTHGSLIEKQGKYAHLFEMQSQYYKEQEKERIRHQIMEGQV